LSDRWYYDDVISSIVRNVQIAVFIQCQARQLLKAVVIEGIVPSFYECPIGAELLHVIVSVIGDIDVTLGIGDDALGVAELPVTAALAAPFFKEFPVGAKFLDSTVLVVQDVDVVARVDGHALGAVKTPICGAFLPDAGRGPLTTIRDARQQNGKDQRHR
jgi:hypothetical protein